MKHALLLTTFLITSFSFSQNQINRGLGDFHKVQTYDLLKVNLIKSEENKVVISGKYAGSVVIKTKN
jgi:hypothetical protein